MTIARFESRQTVGIRWVSHVLQRIVATMLRDRSIGRRLEVASRTYAERRQALIDALHAHDIEAHGASGLNVWIPVDDELSVVQGLLQRGWAVQAGSRYRIGTPPAIRVTVASLATKDALRFGADLAAVVMRSTSSA